MLGLTHDRDAEGLTQCRSLGCLGTMPPPPPADPPDPPPGLAAGAWLGGACDVKLIESLALSLSAATVQEPAPSDKPLLTAPPTAAAEEARVPPAATPAPAAGMRLDDGAVGGLAEDMPW